MWYYTGKGDQGDSSLFDRRQISKGDIVFELIGSLDEATAHLGMAVSLCRVPGLKADLRKTQDYLSNLMGTIADVENAELEGHSFLVRATRWLEKKISDYGKLVKNPQAFLYAGESALGAAIDVSRTVIRRTERIAVRYFGAGNDDGKEILVYLNRLSSLLYILRLYADSSIK